MSDDFMRRFQICDRHLSQGGGHYVEVDESGPWVRFQDAESLLKAANARAEAAEAKLAETEAVLQGIINLGGTMGSALYAETVDRAARQALATLRGEGETNE